MGKTVFQILVDTLYLGISQNMKNLYKNIIKIMKQKKKRGLIWKTIRRFLLIFSLSHSNNRQKFTIFVARNILFISISVIFSF